MVEIMSSVDEKLDKFYLSINHYATEQRQKIEDELTAYKKQQLEQTENELLAEAYQLIQKEMAQMRGAITKELSVKELSLRQSLLTQRSRITNEVFEKAAQKLEEITHTDAYLAMLKKFAKNVFSVLQGDGVVLYLNERDEKYKADIAETFGGPCEIAISPDIKIGGILGVNLNRGVMADETLDAMLKAQQEWFEENSGLAVV